jgi:hypothetical protein
LRRFFVLATNPWRAIQLDAAPLAPTVDVWVRWCHL